MSVTLDYSSLRTIGYMASRCLGVLVFGGILVSSLTGLPCISSCTTHLLSTFPYHFDSDFDIICVGAQKTVIDRSVGVRAQQTTTDRTVRAACFRNKIWNDGPWFTAHFDGLRGLLPVTAIYGTREELFLWRLFRYFRTGVLQFPHQPTKFTEWE